MAVVGPESLPEGEYDYSCPFSSHTLLGVEAEDVQRMRSAQNTQRAYLSDNCVRAIVLHSLEGQGEVSKKIAFFDPQWLANWRHLSKTARDNQCWNAFPRPIAKCGTALERIVLPFNNGAHWNILLFDIPKKELVVYDSMKTEAHTRQCVRAAKLFGQIFDPYLGGPDWFDSWSLRVPDIVQQRDGVSCGVHTILNLLVLLQDMGVLPEEIYPPSHGPHDIAAIRKSYGDILENMLF